jgi:Fic family protein
VRQAVVFDRKEYRATAIEGNRLSLEQVSDLAQGREIMATRKDKQEVLNYLISNRAALDEIMKLLKMKVIKKAGKGRSLRYEIA